MMIMNLMGVDYESITDGEGVRTSIFISGCKHNCSGCHNPSSHDFLAGREFTKDDLYAIIKYIKNVPYISGITLTGGDPMFSAVELIPYINIIKSELPYINIWIYSGFRYEEIIADDSMFNLLKLCDVLVDGRFEIEKKDLTIPYRGSINQRVIDIQKSMSSGIINII